MDNNPSSKSPSAEKLVRGLRYLFKPDAPKYIAYMILAAAVTWIVLIWTAAEPGFLKTLSNAEQSLVITRHSVLITVLATVAALIISLIFIAVELSASAYTSRVVKFHFASAHFVGLSLLFLGTTVYLALRLGLGTGDTATGWALAKTGFVLALACLTLLAPYLWISIRLLQPQHLFARLMETVTRHDFREASHGRRDEINAKLQPLVDIIRRAAKEGQLRTVEESFDALLDAIRRLEHRAQDPRLSAGIGIVLADKLLEIGLYANSLRSFEVSIRMLGFMRDAALFYITRKYPAGILKLRNTLDYLIHDWNLRYPRDQYPLQYGQGMLTFAGVQRSFASILEGSQRTGLLNQSLKLSKYAAGVLKKEVFTIEYARAQSSIAQTCVLLGEMSAGQDKEKYLTMALKTSKIALTYIKADEYPVDYARIITSTGAGNLLMAGVTADKTQRKYLDDAIATLMEVSKLYTPRDNPQDYAEAQQNLGMALYLLAVTQKGQERVDSLNRAVDILDKSAALFDREDLAFNSAACRFLRGNCYVFLMVFKPDDASKYYKLAQRELETVAKVWTEDQFPHNYKALQAGYQQLETAWEKLQETLQKKSS